MSSADPQIVPFDRTRTDEVIEVLARAFAQDPFLTTMLPPDRRHDRIRATFDSELTLAMSVPHVIDLVLADPFDVVGVAVWAPPGTAVPGPMVTVRALPAAVRAGGRSVGRLAQAWSAIARTRPTQPHWYLATLGVRPDHAGRGIGSALLRHRLATIDADGADAYLEASAPPLVGYYERFGFRSLGEVASSGAPPMTRMWRAR